MKNSRFTFRLLTLFFAITILLPAHSLWAGEKAVSVSAMGNFCVALLSDSSLWAWGQNEEGQLGDGSTSERTRPVRVGDGNDWGAVSAGWDHSLALKADGSLWAWGDNSFGQLGIGTARNVHRPVQVGRDTDWSLIEAGEDFSIALKTDGSLWAWGRNNRGQLGSGDSKKNPLFTPQRIGTENDWQGVSVFFAHVLAIREDGTLWGWGNIRYFQTGETPTPQIEIPTQIGDRAGWSSVSTGDSHSLALRADGTLWGVGRNREGQLGNGAHGTGRVEKGFIQIGKESNWSGLAGGGFHSLALKLDGTLWGWGHNREGQVGVGSADLSINAPTQVGESTRWKGVVAGNDHSLAINTDGTLYGWGWNMYGQVGSGKNKTGEPQFIRSPVKISFPGR